MAQTQLNGNTQIQAGTIPLSKLISGYSIPTGNLTEGSLFLKSSGTVTMTANLALGGNYATGSGINPINASDLVPKSYVDAKVMGFSLHGARVVSVSNIGALTGLLSIDGITVLTNDIILLTAQTTGSQNGPWLASSGSWTRPSWWASASTQPEGAYFLIDPDGTTYKNTKWWMVNTGTITVDTTSVSFLQDQSGTTYTNGTGLGLAGSTFSVTYGTTAGTAAQGNDTRITGAVQSSSLASGVLTALGVTTGTTGSVVLYNGALGTPTAVNLTNGTGLPISTGVSGLGTGVAAALAVAAGTGAGFATLTGGYLSSADFPALVGDVTTTAGSLTTVVNNTSGSGFLKYTNYVWNETPTGLVNGVNTIYTLAYTPANAGVAIMLELNGMTLEPGAGNDFTISGANITMLFAPVTGDKLRAFYLY